MAIITISRLYGIDGKTIANQVAQKLGYALFDQEIIQFISEKARVDPHWVATVEKEIGGKFFKFINQIIPKKIPTFPSTVASGYLTEDIYFEFLKLIFEKIANTGNAVVLGRGGQFMLKDTPNVRHILLIASKTTRLNYICSQENLSIDEAKNKMITEDEKRTCFLKKFKVNKIDHPYHYHLIINVDKLKFDDICNLIYASVESQTGNKN